MLRGFSENIVELEYKVNISEDSEVMTKLEVLKNSNFGERVAEYELDHLESYFVETETWERLRNGDIDIVYGPKGSGKSALYSYLLAKRDFFYEKGILLIAAEELEGKPIFNQVLEGESLDDATFKHLWFIFILTLIGDEIKTYKDKSEEVKLFVTKLQQERLLEGSSLRRILTDVRDYVVNAFSRLKTVEHAVALDENGLPTFSQKITINEPNRELRKFGYISVFDLFEMANNALKSLDLKVWILFDRLDVAFINSIEMEKVALRTLFRTYSDLAAFTNIKLKIFIRDDIWKRISDQGFREGSHIIKQVTISWNEDDLRYLIMSRILQNEVVCSYLGVEKQEVLSDVRLQQRAFYSIFPVKMETGKSPETFKWMLSRIKDGLNNVAPRELIHLITEARTDQVKQIEKGNRETLFAQLINRSAIKNALKQVSKTKLEQTIYTEYPELKQYIERLRGKKTEQVKKTLSQIFIMDELKVDEIIQHLVEIGFFEEKSKGKEVSYKIPFLYRDALSTIQGRQNEV